MSGSGSPESGSNFHLGFFFLPREKREALSAVYSFARVVDDIVDSGENTPEEAAGKLDLWKEEVERLYQGKPTDPVAERLAPYVERYGLPREGFDELVKGVEMDLRKKRYGTFLELEKYLFGVAGSVGLLAVEIFGHEHTPPGVLREYAVTMGNAFQLTNIMRDVGTDLERGRIYLPLEDIRGAGYSEGEFAARSHTPSFQSLMSREYERAKGFYKRARSLLHPLDRPRMTPAEVMSRIYEGLLERMRREQYRVFFRRVRLPAWRKALAAASGWLASRSAT